MVVYGFDSREKFKNHAKLLSLDDFEMPLLSLMVKQTGL